VEWALGLRWVCPHNQGNYLIKKIQGGFFAEKNFYKDDISIPQ
jgi:hypothetical protein